MKINRDKIIPTFLLLVLFLLLFPSLFEPTSYGDECIYLTLGNAFSRGLVFYRDIHDNKPPLLYLTAALSFGRLWLFHFFSLIWSLAELITVYFFVKLLTKSKLIRLLSGLAFIFLYLSFEGRTANGENFMILPVTLAAYLLFKEKPEKRKKENQLALGISAGILFSLGFLFKVPVAFDFIGIILALFFFSLEKVNKKEIINQLKNKKLWGMILGFSAPTLLSIGYYWQKGAFTPYVRSALLQNIGYLSSWGGSGSGLISRAIVLLLVSLILFLYRKKIPFAHLFSFAWFCFSLFGALLSGRPYPHYLIETIPSLILLLALAGDNLLGLVGKRGKTELRLLFLPLLAIGLLKFSHNYYHFWRYPQLSYYQNWLEYLSGQQSKEEYFLFWGEQVPHYYQIAEFIKQTTLPQEKIFLWGEGSCIYALSQRLPPGRYMVNYHIFDFNGFEETLGAIKKQKPRIIVKLKEEKRSWPDLDLYLHQYYYPVSLPGIKDQIFLRHEKISRQW